MKNLISFRRRRTVGTLGENLTFDSIRILGSDLVFGGTRCEDVALDLEKLLVADLVGLGKALQ